ncbi:MAG: GntR family transcriptional regulator [Candidatus Hydrogenedentes bacterium]|nr:GntR family transcriptional regulator [Candidatus Hydrogenedentota bacterium]
MSPRAKHEAPKEVMQLLDNVNIFSSVAVYLQIENSVRFAIAAGKLTAGDQLPSVRELSERLEVNPNTVAKAYRDLEVMGLLYTRRGMGVFIQKSIDDKCRADVSREMMGRVFEVICEAKASGLKDKDIQAIVKKCLGESVAPYSPLPKGVQDWLK